MAGFKLMKTYAEYIKHINESTLQSNFNQGLAIDPMRTTTKEKQRNIEFGKIKKMGYNISNFISEQTGPQSNHGKLR